MVVSICSIFINLNTASNISFVSCWFFHVTPTVFIIILSVSVMNLIFALENVFQDTRGALFHWMSPFFSPVLWGVIIGMILLLSSLAIYDANARHKFPVPVKVLAVLGSGGHTREMLALMKSLSPVVFSPRTYVYSKNDTLSRKKAEQLEKTIGSSNYTCRAIPRSREVGQSYLTSVFTTLYSFLAAFGIVLQERPDVIICTGPGVCLPIVYSAVIFKCVGLLKTRIIFSESICRVKSLSLTGRLVYPVSNDFLVQWEEMKERFKGAEYIGRVC